MTCPYCGTELQANAQTCDFCGGHIAYAPAVGLSPSAQLSQAPAPAPIAPPAPVAVPPAPQPADWASTQRSDQAVPQAPQRSDRAAPQVLVPQAPQGFNIFALAGFLFCLFPMPVPFGHVAGLVMCIIGLKKWDPQKKEKGRGLAVAGIVVFAVQVVLLIAAVVLAVLAAGKAVGAAAAVPAFSWNM